MDNALKTSLLGILRPLVRHLIGRGWTFPVLAEFLKSIYVAEAQTHYGEDPEAMTDSSLSLLTGIHRKDIKRLRAELREASFVPGLRRDAGLAARVVAAWVSSPRYLDARKHPKALPLTAGSGRLSFEKLVRETRADMRPNVILDELVRVGVAEIGEDNRVRLLRNAYVSDLPRDKIAYLGDNVGDHLQSALYNVTGQGKPFLERAVYYELIVPEALEKIRPELFRLSEEFLQAINRKVMPLNTEAIHRRESRGRRMRLGVFYYEDKSRLAPDEVRRRHTKRERKL
ncbi:MAG: hypothetical protein HY274_07860 [Gammaproteobacteria bacterium]|nr:hypothetical protein [Gammaproteobacteria bacterium]